MMGATEVLVGKSTVWCLPEVALPAASIEEEEEEIYTLYKSRSPTTGFLTGLRGGVVAFEPEPAGEASCTFGGCLSNSWQPSRSIGSLLTRITGQPEAHCVCLYQASLSASLPRT